MAQPYVGEIRIFAGNFAPLDWMFCDGSALPISENETLFTVIGTTYGGDGETTFNIPDLRGRVPIHQGQGPGLSNRVIGEAGGAEEVTLTVNQTPAHTHPLLGSTQIASTATPQGSVPAQDNIVGVDFYIEDTPNANMAPTAIASVGGSQPHTNFQPYICINYIISLFGLYPPPS
jgi:microcystin-dependent protein